VVNPDMAIMQVQSRFSSRLLKGRTLTATFTEDILALYGVSPETLHILYSHIQISHHII